MAGKDSFEVNKTCNDPCIVWENRLINSKLIISMKKIKFPISYDKKGST